MWADDRLDFNGLVPRLGSTHVGAIRLSRERPASYVAFDCLGVGAIDIRRRPFIDRALSELALTWGRPLNLSPTTTDLATTAGWFDEMAVAGMEGMVVKGASQPYRGGKADW